MTESIVTKNRQPIDVLGAMVARTYGRDQVPEGQEWAEELGSGGINGTYRIRLRDGRRVVLKIGPSPESDVMTYERSMIHTEVHALALVRAFTDVPVPAMHHYDDSHKLCESDYFFMDYIDADSLGAVAEQLPVAEYERYTQAMGATNRALNQIQGDHFGPLLGGDPDVSWRRVFTRIVEDVLGDGQRRGVDLGFDYADVRQLVAEHADSLEEVTEPVFVEGGLWDDNIMIGDGGIVSVLGHERAMYGDPLMEFGFAATTVAGMPDPTGFLLGYGRTPTTPAEVTRRRLYSLHMLLVMVIETVYRGHAEPGQYDWARARLAELVASFADRA